MTRTQRTAMALGHSLMKMKPCYCSVQFSSVQVRAVSGLDDPLGIRVDRVERIHVGIVGKTAFTYLRRVVKVSVM